jgi:hypothetical protein
MWVPLSLKAPQSLISYSSEGLHDHLGARPVKIGHGLRDQVHCLFVHPRCSHLGAKCRVIGLPLTLERDRLLYQCC